MTYDCKSSMTHFPIAVSKNRMESPYILLVIAILDTVFGNASRIMAWRRP